MASPAFITRVAIFSLCSRFEGAAISWHLLEVLPPRVPVRRLVFHEITSAAIATLLSMDLSTVAPTLLYQP
jgi:DNA topoisomerase IA